jgi:hypothetical protein
MVNFTLFVFEQTAVNGKDVFQELSNGRKSIKSERPSLSVSEVEVDVPM